MQRLKILQRTPSGEALPGDVRRASFGSTGLKYPRTAGSACSSAADISIIIPCINEEESISRLICHLQSCDCAQFLREIIVVDGGSSDRTIAAATASGVRAVLCPQKGRAAQMNFGAKLARGNILYFLHADSLPPRRCLQDIARMVVERNTAGCYRLKFDTDHWFLRACCWFTRFDIDAVRFGDQSLFLSSAVFAQIGGFDSTMQLMEDQEIIARIKRHSSFAVADDSVVTSARKYKQNGTFRLQFIYLAICILYAFGCSQSALLKVYKRLITQEKI